MKLIYLDLDGVILTDKGTKYASVWNPFNIQLSQYSTKLHNTMDINCLNRLNNLIEFSGAKVILSSMWRLTHYELVKTHLPLLGFIGDIIDKTDLIPTKWTEEEMANRGKEIDKHVRDNNVEEYVILDDNPFGVCNFLPHQKSKLVRTSMIFGMSEEDLELAKTIIGAK